MASDERAEVQSGLSTPGLGCLLSGLQFHTTAEWQETTAFTKFTHSSHSSVFNLGEFINWQNEISSGLIVFSASSISVISVLTLFFAAGPASQETQAPQKIQGETSKFWFLDSLQVLTSFCSLPMASGPSILHLLIPLALTTWPLLLTLPQLGWGMWPHSTFLLQGWPLHSSLCGPPGGSTASLGEGSVSCAYPEQLLYPSIYTTPQTDVFEKTIRKFGQLICSDTRLGEIDFVPGIFPFSPLPCDLHPTLASVIENDFHFYMFFFNC